jgi:hypothetical protein
VFTPIEEIRAGSTVSQRLAEAYARNSAPAGTNVPPWATDFSDIFNKESFDSLPEKRVWHHAIELIPDAKPANCKVYLITLLEQKELDAFIAEGLSTGHIRLSKSPMASPVFFIKKKDRALRFVQDYWALNAMTVKNRYLLPLINDLIMGTGTALDRSGMFVFVYSLSLFTFACSLVYSLPHAPDVLISARQNAAKVQKCLALQKFPQEFELFPCFQ